MIPPAFTYVTHVFELDLTLTLQGDGETCLFLDQALLWVGVGFQVALEVLDPSS